MTTGIQSNLTTFTKIPQLFCMVSTQVKTLNQNWNEKIYVYIQCKMVLFLAKKHGELEIGKKKKKKEKLNKTADQFG